MTNDLSTVIASLELLAVIMAVKLWTPVNNSKAMLYHISSETDSMVCCHATKRWYSPSPVLNTVLKELALTCYKLDLELGLAHIPGVDNVYADRLSRRNFSGFDGKKRIRVAVQDKKWWSPWVFRA